MKKFQKVKLKVSNRERGVMIGEQHIKRLYENCSRNR